MECPNCGYNLTYKNGKDRKGNQRYYCENCWRTFGEARVKRAGLENKVESLERQIKVYSRELSEINHILQSLDAQLVLTLTGYHTQFEPEEIPF